LAKINKSDDPTSAKQYIEYDTARPNIAFFIVAFFQYFRRDIVGLMIGCRKKYQNSSNFLIHLVVRVENSTGPEVNDLDCCSRLTGLEEHVFGLEVSVHDIIRVAITDGT
jgi:hypothetical protein